MTPKLKWSEMSADERDALVAEKVMGWTDVVWAHPVGGAITPEPPCGRAPWGYSKLSKYSTSISAAFEVLEKLRADGFVLSITNPVMNWRIAFIKGSVWVGSESDFLPEAISLAALRAVGVEVDL